MEANSSLVQTVLKWPLPKIREWLDGLSIGEPVDGTHFNWHGFAYALALRARQERSLGWAHIALLVYGVLAQRHSDEEEYSFSLSEMSLRAWMIAELGEREGDFVLDSEPIVEWVQRLTIMPLEEAAHWIALGDLHAVPIEKLRAMRRLKHGLNTLAHALHNTQVEQKHPELVPWLQFRTRLV
ncbi:conserved hypothetical protein [Myxococcus xanthus DK 1622]|uniref:Uncharacterized protein n=1 Tax=Myxococcus xanthus (strain DK1622) TaxID=246197 RepID=Q1CY88_MYXXD|nr:MULTISPECIES: hypothetical protein [Myxococcus]ABF87596.1 conserved hypothetical protein [Myxococcus xanthus DK 1622]NOJ56914.1 hypothetical protein [Myxococcus xanthus]QPM78846.1 hypothetical protein I5Q59_32105 [Myxococcus xanthus]QVW67916.1 hypothetical protein JTM82_37460 [Myxococcus xanthus DZ2]QZZ54135.1 hypothetical protein MyxoNM_33405 [Myxococcus xanthus]